MRNKQTTLFGLLIAGMLSVSACNNADNNKAKDMTDSLATKVDTMTSEVKQEAAKVADQAENEMYPNPDSNFVVKASLDNAKELRLLEAGVTNGTDKDLKAHAKMMIADHKKLGAGVKAYAAKKNYSLPDGDNGKADDELATLGNKTKGADWDKEWTDALTSGHKDAVDLFEKSKDKVKDPELQKMITGALPTLHAHLDMMTQLQAKLGK